MSDNLALESTEKIQNTLLIAIAWALHYIPFFLMKRQVPILSLFNRKSNSLKLFLHHYFPALYFSILTFGLTLDLFIKNRKGLIQGAIIFSLLVICIKLFIDFAPISYGFNLEKSACEKLVWSDKWGLNW